MGGKSYDSTLPHKVIGSHVAYGTHKVRIFFRLLLFSVLLLMANQGGNQTYKVSSMLQKLLMLHVGQKVAKTKTMDFLCTLYNKSCSY